MPASDDEFESRKGVFPLGVVLQHELVQQSVDGGGVELLLGQSLQVYDLDETGDHVQQTVVVVRGSSLQQLAQVRDQREQLRVRNGLAC